MAEHRMPDQDEVTIERDVTYTVTESPSARVRRDSAVRAVVSDLTSSFVHDIIVPAVKGMLLDMVHGVTEKVDDLSEDAILGKDNSSGRYVRDSHGRRRQAYTSYDSYSKGKTTAERNSLASGRAVVRGKRRLKSPVDVADVPFRSETEAMEVLSFLTGRAAQYTWTTMDDFYGHRYVDVIPDPQDAYFGWDLDMLRKGSVYKATDGYWRIDVPVSVQIPDEER